MALRKPLVLASGQMQQLQAGDTLDAPQGGGDVIVLTNDEASPVVIGAPVYADANDGFKKARANAAATRSTIGLVAISPSIGNGSTGPVITSGVLVATTAEWDAVAGTAGGLVFNAKYYLDAATAGKITATAPTTVGQYVMQLGVAISTTELLVRVKQDILL